ncbi:unnamed protein product [Moneuplotes crassus]|uniref:C2H2-type domain-containing protein n=1 Tax=Euplotes crassus TaxID=5936 RepID=A0AAD1YD87_EUPCR|nr:unnamed protein product [Moneuplotes crassus]
MDPQIIAKRLALNHLEILARYQSILTPSALLVLKNQESYCFDNCSKQQFISIRDKPKPQTGNNELGQRDKETNDKSSVGGIHYKNYKELKEIVTKRESEVSKTELYENLLKPFQHEKRTQALPVSGKPITIYICKYEGCNKEYTKIWNLVDHARMHEGIRPYECSFCSRAFTQKVNLKKHLKQHEHKNIEERRKFQCNICNKRYTERYNLIAHMKTHEQNRIPPKSKATVAKSKRKKE